MLNKLENPTTELIHGDPDEILFEMNFDYFTMKLEPTQGYISLRRSVLIDAINNIRSDSIFSKDVLFLYNCNIKEAEFDLKGENSTLEGEHARDWVVRTEARIMSLSGIPSTSVEWNILMPSFVNTVGKIVFDLNSTAAGEDNA